MLLCIFVFFRPIVLMHGMNELGSFRILELFSMAASYVLLIAIFTNIKNIKLSAIDLLIILLCFYSAFRISLGADVKEEIRIILPFIVFYATTCLIENKKQIEILLGCLILGFSIFICANTITIGVFNQGIDMEIYQIGLVRYGGLTFGSHSLAHSMFIFIVTYYFFKELFPVNNKWIKGLLLLLMIMALYCIYKASTRTVFVGLTVFIGLYYFFKSKKLFILIVLAVLCVGIINKEKVIARFWDVQQAAMSQNLSGAGSGRIGIWSQSLSYYGGLSFEEKMVGSNIRPTEDLTKKKFFIHNTHNDYIGLLLTYGIIGLLIYLAILGLCLKAAIMFKDDKILKHLFLSFFFAVAIMNGLSNSYLTRVDMGQFFWLFVGIFFLQKRFAVAKK